MQDTIVFFLAVCFAEVYILKQKNLINLFFLFFSNRACRGKLVTLIIRFPSQGRQPDDIEVFSHTNDTIGAVRRQILHRVKASSNIKVDLYLNGEMLDANEDRRLISQAQIREKTVSTS